MPEVEHRVAADSVDDVLAEFDRRKDQLTDASKETVRLIERILKEEAIAVQSVQARVKSKEKLRVKYCNSKKDYKRLDDISDLVGIRIITYYSDMIDRIADITRREFKPLRPEDDKRIGDPEAFGYSALHIDCAYSQKRLENTEYKRFSNACFEIQITTILGHAWAEMHHAWYDANDAPREEERRFHRLAAVLELAEQEFLEIRKKKEDRERIAEVRVAAEAPEIPITPESLRAFIAQKEIVEVIDSELAGILGRALTEPSGRELPYFAEMLIRTKMDTTQKLEQNLTKYAPAVLEYIKRCIPVWNAAQIPLPDTLTRGFCISYLVNFLVCTTGEEQYRSFLKSLGIVTLPQFDHSKQVAIAIEVAKDNHIFGNVVV